jgi:hypothetical protein
MYATIVRYHDFQTSCLAIASLLDNKEKQNWYFNISIYQHLKRRNKKRKKECSIFENPRRGRSSRPSHLSPLFLSSDLSSSLAPSGLKYKHWIQLPL